MKKSLTLTLTLAVGLTAAIGGLAQTPPPAPPAHPSLMQRLFHHPKPMMNTPRPLMTRPMMGGRTAISGGIIGNKNTHVYHMPGDTGSLPAPQNRVYFHTQGEALAAGYHRVGATHGTMMRRPMTHPTMMHH